MAEENTTDKKDTTGLGQFDLDKIAGVGMSAKQAKAVDTKAIDEQIAALEKPASGSVYDKLAARYRSQGEGAVLRTQKNLTNLFGPTVNLIQEREAAAQARFTLLKDKLPEFDDTKIFGMQSGNEMPIVAEIESISKTTKEDMRMLSRLNPNDERYDEIKKRVEKNQDAIVAFDEINKKLLEIRNSQDGREDDSQWSRGMDSTTRQMWEDIYASKGENIKIQDGKLVWTDTKGKTSYDLEKAIRLIPYDNDLSQMRLHKKYIENNTANSTDFLNIQTRLNNLGITSDDGKELDEDGKWGPKTQEAYDKYLAQKDELETAWLDENLTDEEKKKFGTTTGVGETRTIDLNEIGDGPTMIDNLGIKKDIEVQNIIQKLINDGVTVNTPGYESQVNALIRTLNSTGPKGIKSLIFDGFGAQQGDVLKSTNTDFFIQQIIQNNPEEFGIKDINNLTEEEIANAYDIMRSRDVTHDYKNNEGKSQTLQSQYLQWYRNEIDTKVREGKKSKLVATQQGSGSGSGSGSRSGSGSGSGGKKPPVNTTKWSDFKAFAKTEDFINDGVEVNLPTLGGEGKMTINKDGTYNVVFSEDAIGNAENLTAKQAAILLQEQYPNISIEAIEDALLGKKIDGEWNMDEKWDVDLIRKQTENRSEGLDIDYIVDNLWEPNTPTGYDMGENGKALFNYLEYKGVGTNQNIITGEDEPYKLYFYNTGPDGNQNYVMTYSGEHVRIHYLKENGEKGEKVMSRTGDSTWNFGGDKADKNNIMQMFEVLGIRGY
jgi:hypothetical protein